MFNTKVWFALSLVIMVLVVSAASKPAQALSNTWHFSNVGMGAEAGFSNCTSWPVPNGTICTDTYIWVAEQVYKDNGTKYPGTTMSVSQYQYKYDKKGNWVYVSDSWGWGDATLSIDNKLTSATASSTLQMTKCSLDRIGNYTCKESLVPVSISCNGFGDLVRSNGNNHTVSKGYTYNSHFQGTYREATCQVNGLDAGTMSWGSLFNTRWMDIYVSHGAW